MTLLAVCLGTMGSVAMAQNTSYGTGALASNTTGGDNAAFGGDALTANTSGWDNSAFGILALVNNLTGTANIAVGNFSMYENTSGSFNSVLGYAALQDNTTGSYNVASGAWSMESNTTGASNTAIGYDALVYNSTGNDNTAFGGRALLNNTTGGYNIGIGENAGEEAPGGSSNNIEIGSPGASTDNGTIRIGTVGVQESFFVAGVYSVPTGLSNAVNVVVDSHGQLGTVKSSIRYKEDVHDMADASSALMRLRPVTYRYKQAYADGSKPVDYGLIAEEVAEVYPNLVARNADGQVETVLYQKLTPMLLNEVQKEHRLLEEQAKSLADEKQLADAQERTIQQLQRQLAVMPTLEKRLAALEAAQASRGVLETLLEKK
ncbi:MAG: tail fiber domain-containing protein [Terracidiphilus sp.]